MSSTGPPELPWFSAASVLTAFSIVKPLRLDLAADGADHAGGEGALETERAAQHDDRASTSSAPVGANWSTVSLELGRSTSSTVGGRIGADDLGVDLGAVGELDLHGLRVVNDVLVGDDVPSSSMTKPEPVASPGLCSNGESGRPPVLACTSTTASL